MFRYLSILAFSQFCIFFKHSLHTLSKLVCPQNAHTGGKIALIIFSNISILKTPFCFSLYLILCNFSKKIVLQIST